MNAIFTNDTIGFNSLKIKFQFVSVRLQKNILTCSNETMKVNILYKKDQFQSIISKFLSKINGI